ncbi:IS3 family transposase [Flammeovirgaceae bacterium SG7u.111]|nr:IS3 family transposase [Flammeovirgaceae bacterium SG7u.132]WPO33047.1 IS3 family transposase [Flammeovirgaceae bacterium SG7u.111]
MRTPRKKPTPEAGEAILAITGRKSTYGVPRVRAILKRDYGIELSRYMVHKFMKQENLLVKRGRKRGAGRPHTGKIAVGQPNTRWASDITSIKCWNGQKVRFAYVLDCCDRSIIAWTAGIHIQACDIELMLQEAIFNRFGEALPEKGKLQFLHDNGPEYIENNLRKQIALWHIADCSTPLYSPQSNGMCEAFNGTFKRDYVYESCLDNPEMIYSQIRGWIDEYNQYAPHSALDMKTPNEFYNFKTAA